MTYSLDLRKRVLSFVEGGGSKSAASRVFGVGRNTVYSWLRRPGLAPLPPGPRRRKLDRAALMRERAEHFSVSIGSVSRALALLGVTRKKKPCATSSATPGPGPAGSGRCV